MDFAPKLKVSEILKPGLMYMIAFLVSFTDKNLGKWYIMIFGEAIRIRRKRASYVRYSAKFFNQIY